MEHEPILKKITLNQFYDLLLDDETSEEDVYAYTYVVKGKGGFDFTLVPDPEVVEYDSSNLGAEEGLMNIGNAWYRGRRRKKFKKQLRAGDKRPVLVSEGDSWFQFPKLIDEVIDHLATDYLIWSCGAAGDTVENMVMSKEESKKTEYMIALRAQKQHVKAFLFSGAGNDIIGENPVTKVSSLQNLLFSYRDVTNKVAESYIDQVAFSAVLGGIEKAYIKVIDTIRSEPGFESLPIIFHGYDYPFPFPWGESDRRDPSYASNNEWLGEAFEAHNYPAEPIRREILVVLIDSLYDMLHSIAGNSVETNIWIVDCRGAMPNLTDWNDEIHGTSLGFSAVSVRFRSTLDMVFLGVQVSST